MTVQTLQQQRAKAALAAIRALKDIDAKKIQTRAAELPFMIQSNGLGQAAAFFRSKKNKDGYDKLFEILQSWLCDGHPYSPHKGKIEKDLLSAITQGDMTQYRLAQAEAMQYMVWVKQFAHAYLNAGE